MSEKENREIRQVRLRLIDIIKSFYDGEPDERRVNRWRETFAALAKERISPSFDKNVLAVHALLGQVSLADIQEEFYALFVDPFGKNQMSTSASFYIDGKTHGQTLVALRSMLADLDVVKKEDVTETEDSIIIMLDIFSISFPCWSRKEVGLRLKRLRKHNLSYLKNICCLFQKNYSNPAEKIQRLIFMQQSCRENPKADFYAACTDFFCGYLELEKGLHGLEVPR